MGNLSIVEMMRQPWVKQMLQYLHPPCKYIFGKWLLVYDDERDGRRGLGATVLQQRPIDVFQFKKSLGYHWPFYGPKEPLAKDKPSDNKQQSQVEVGSSDEPQALSAVPLTAEDEHQPLSPASRANNPLNCTGTLVNVFVFCANAYFLWFDTIFWEEKLDDDKKCSYTRARNQSRMFPLLDFAILFAYLAVPIFVANGFKFLFEYDAFGVIRAWYSHIREEEQQEHPKDQDGQGGGQNEAELLTKKVYIQTRVQFWLGILLCLLLIVGAGYLMLSDCPSSPEGYKFVSFVFVVILVASGLISLLGPFAIIYMHMIFVNGRTKLFKKKLAALTSDYEKEVNGAVEEAVEFVNEVKDSPIPKDLESDTRGQIEKIEEQRKKREQYLDIRKFQIGCNFDEKMREQHRKADKMVCRARFIYGRVDRPTAVSFGCLCWVGFWVGVYLFYYSLSFYQEHWPKIRETVYMCNQLDPSHAPSLSSAPSNLPSLPPSNSAQPSSIPSDRPSLSPSNSAQPFLIPSNQAPSSPTNTWGIAVWDEVLDTVADVYITGAGTGTASIPTKEPTGDADGIAKCSLEYIFEKMEAVDRHGLLFVCGLAVIILLVVLYLATFAMFFASQADSWNELVTFCTCRASLNNEAESSSRYGAEFDRVAMFLKNSDDIFRWSFIVKGNYETASAFVWAQLSKRLLATGITVVLPQLLAFLAEQGGVTRAYNAFDEHFNFTGWLNATGEAIGSS